LTDLVASIKELEKLSKGFEETRSPFNFCGHKGFANPTNR
jgi:hypothetical protein